MYVGEFNILGWLLDMIWNDDFATECPIPLPSKMAEKAMESFREISKFGKRLSLSSTVQSFYYHLCMYVVVQSGVDAASLCL